MRRRSFLKTGLSAGGLAPLGIGTKRLLAHIRLITSTDISFGSGPPVAEVLYQSPFSADDYPSWNVVMALTPPREIVPNYGTAHHVVCDEVGPAKKDGKTWTSRFEVNQSLSNHIWMKVGGVVL